LRYAVLLNPYALASVDAALNKRGVITVLADVRKLMAELVSPSADCIVLDPALLTPSLAETTATHLAESSRHVVAFSSVTPAALESAVILAQQTSARFVFRGTPNERSLLERALLLTPYTELHAMLLEMIDPQIQRLPAMLRETVVTMFQTGDGPHSPDGLARATRVTRRSVDRCLGEAGLVPTRPLVEGARIVSGYHAMTTASIPLRSVASMLGYNVQRTMDAQVKALLGTTSGALRAHPLSCTEAASRLALNLTIRESRRNRMSQKPTPAAADVRSSLKLIKGNAPSTNVRRTAGD
jgi:hypothetical protein